MHGPLKGAHADVCASPSSVRDRWPAAFRHVLQPFFHGGGPLHRRGNSNSSQDGMLFSPGYVGVKLPENASNEQQSHHNETRYNGDDDTDEESHENEETQRLLCKKRCSQGLNEG